MGMGSQPGSPLFVRCCKTQVFPLTFFNIHMKLLGEVISQFGIQYQQYAGVVQLYTATLSYIGDALNILTGDYAALDGIEKHKPYTKENIHCRSLPFVIVSLGGMALPLKDLEVLLDFQLLVNKQAETVPQKTLAQQGNYSLRNIPDGRSVVQFLTPYRTHLIGNACLALIDLFIQPSTFLHVVPECPAPMQLYALCFSL